MPLRGRGCSQPPQHPHSAGWSQPVGLILAVPKLQWLPGAQSSLHFRLEAATNPSASDSYSDRASSRSSAYTRRENRLAALSSRAEEESNRDYKKVGFLRCFIVTACTLEAAHGCRNLPRESLERKSFIFISCFHCFRRSPWPCSKASALQGVEKGAGAVGHGVRYPGEGD